MEDLFFMALVEHFGGQLIEEDKFGKAEDFLQAVGQINWLRKLVD
jgi:hypothetical protein